MDGKLFSYYAECVAAEGGWNARAANSQRGRKWVRLDLNLTNLEHDNGVFEIPVRQVGELLSDVRQKRASSALFVGFPCVVVKKRIGKGQGERVISSIIPALLFPVDWKLVRDKLTVRVLLDQPTLNQQLLQLIPSSEDDRRAFVDHVGLSEWGLNDTRRILKRLSDGIREFVKTAQDGGDLGESDVRSGIHDRAVLMIGERPRFTIGLEDELKQLSRTFKQGQWIGTALEQIAQDTPFDTPRDTPSGRQPDPNTRDSSRYGLVEVMPLSGDQKAACYAALSEPLSTVTGPPGTGKSQVVTVILANALLRGETALISSKNHKAVSVVEDRLRQICGRTVMLRLGARSGERDTMAEIEAFLDYVLAEQKSKIRQLNAINAKKAYEEARAGLQQVLGGARAGKAAAQASQDLKALKEQYGAGLIEGLEKFPMAKIDRRVRGLPRIIDENARRTKGFLSRSRIEGERARAARMVDEVLRIFRPHADLFGEMPERSLSESADWALYAEVARRVSGRVDLCFRVKELASQTLQSTRPDPHTIAVAEMEVTERAMGWIAAWVESIPDRIGDDDRVQLTRFRRLLGEIRDGGVRNAKGLRVEMLKLMPQMLKIIPIWAVTNLSARGSLPLVPALFDRVIIDEASQCDIASALPILFRAKYATIIGDPNQLRHIALVTRRDAAKIEEKYGLPASEMEGWHFEQSSLYDRASRARRGRVILLADHFRSHPRIIGFSNALWYEGGLKIRTNIAALTTPRGYQAGIAWHQVAGPTQRPPYGGLLAEAEAAEVAAFVERFMRDGFDGTIGVVTPFRAQANRVSEHIRNRIPLEAVERHDLIVDTAHGFQGDERDVVIFSPCIGADIPEAARQFLRRTDNLLNVAVTRARGLLLIVGDRRAARTCRVRHIEALASYRGIQEELAEVA